MHDPVEVSKIVQCQKNVCNQEIVQGDCVIRVTHIHCCGNSCSKRFLIFLWKVDLQLSEEI